MDFSFAFLTAKGFGELTTLIPPSFSFPPEKFQHKTFQLIPVFIWTLSTLYTDKNCGKTNSSHSSKALLDLITC